MCRSDCRGFTYVALMVAIAVFGLGSASFATYWSETHRAEREREWLRVGDEFVRAIANYYESSPGAVKRYPRELADLVQDNRFLGSRRHLRKLYFDPITGSAEWGLVRAADGGIMGVYSLSPWAPKKKALYPTWAQGTPAPERYVDVKFVYVPCSAPRC